MSISWSQFGNTIIRNARKKRIPLVAQFELTSRCNLRCKMCYVCNTKNTSEIIKREKTAEEWIDLARQARDAGVLYVLLTGGEVFLRSDFRQIYEAISEMGFSVQIYTNGTLITPEIAKWLGKRPPSKISVTMYGGTPQTYKAITGSAEAYEKAKRGVDLLLAEGILTKVRTTVVKGNCNDVEKIFDFTYDRGIEFGSIHEISQRREGDDTDPAGERLSPKEVMEYEKRLSSYIKNKKKYDDATVPKKEAEEPDIDKVIEDKTTENVKINSFACSASHCAFWVTWDGRLTPCGLLPEPSVDVFEMGFLAAWEMLKKQCDKIPSCKECDNCKYKPFCFICPARLYAENGKYDTCASYIKEIAIMRYERRESKPM